MRARASAAARAPSAPGRRRAPAAPLPPAAPAAPRARRPALDLDLDRARQLLGDRLRRLELPRPRGDRRAEALVAAALASAGPAGAATGAAIAGSVPGIGDPAAVTRRLVERVTYGWSLAEQQEIERLGHRAYLERQLHPEEIDDGGLDDALEAALPSLAMTPGRRLVTYFETPEVPFFELQLATLYRAVYSPRQLFERLAMLWTDHFNIHIFSDFGIWLKPTDDREVVRRHALGRFPDLLRASAHSPAMLDYLTNDSNVRGHPNENYSRELMELHTLGVDGGFTQQDVREVARCFTGWSFRPYQAGLRFGEYVFRSADHDYGAKVVLGTALPAGRGQADGETVIDLLAGHPSTARFIAGKLLGWVWGYQPDERTVERLAGIYATTGGDLRAMLRFALSWHRVAGASGKLKRPFHLLVSAARALFAELANPFGLLEGMLAAGQLPFNWAPPNGYPDAEGYWSGFVLPRWNAAGTLVGRQGAPLALDLPALDPSLPVPQLVGVLDALLAGGTLSDSTRGALAAYLAGGPRTPQRLAEAVGLAVASPEFQGY